jgi:hypothetical protein
MKRIEAIRCDYRTEPESAFFAGFGFGLYLELRGIVAVRSRILQRMHRVRSRSLQRMRRVMVLAHLSPALLVKESADHRGRSSTGDSKGMASASL